ncbi:MAG: VanZ family protein [Lachnospiraceae bacterium]|nr:VanZ family protein [Lachnospiraceae bacterium]
MMKRFRKIIITILFLVYLTIVLRITVFRSTFTLQYLCQNGKVILTLLEGYIDLIKRGDWFAFTYLFVGNIVWFVPFGMYLQYMGKQKTLLHTTIYGFLFSLLIETLQYVFGTGFSELDDLVLNTLGAWIGGGLVKAGTRFIACRWQE